MNLRIVILFLLSYLSIIVAAQNESASYYFEGDYVVFEFDGAKYLELSDSLGTDTMAFSDLNISIVELQPGTSDFMIYGWELSHIRDQQFRLKKKIESFGENFDWEFRYLINQKYWVKPTLLNEVLVRPQDVLADLYDYDPYHLQEVDTGAVLFRLEGFTEAKNVILTGTFNGWKEHQIKMKFANDGWEKRLKLDRGIHEYKFIVDGEWMHDPNNPNKIRNEHRTFNSILNNAPNIKLSLTGYTDAKRVYVAGTFNNWKKRSLELHKSDEGWEINLPINPGKHYYKFIVDGNWMTDPNALENETDIDGNLNSVLYIR